MSLLIPVFLTQELHYLLSQLSGSLGLLSGGSLVSPKPYLYLTAGAPPASLVVGFDHITCRHPLKFGKLENITMSSLLQCPPVHLKACGV